MDVVVNVAENVVVDVKSVSVVGDVEFVVVVVVMVVLLVVVKSVVCSRG